MIPGTVVLTLLIDLQRCDTDDTFDTNGSGVNKLSVTMKYFEHLAMTGHNMSSVLTHRLDCWYHKKPFGYLHHLIDMKANVSVHSMCVFVAFRLESFMFSGFKQQHKYFS